MTPHRRRARERGRPRAQRAAAVGARARRRGAAAAARNDEQVVLRWPMSAIATCAPSTASASRPREKLNSTFGCVSVPRPERHDAAQRAAAHRVVLSASEPVAPPNSRGAIPAIISGKMARPGTERVCRSRRAPTRVVLVVLRARVRVRGRLVGTAAVKSIAPKNATATNEHSVNVGTCARARRRTSRAQPSRSHSPASGRRAPSSAASDEDVHVQQREAGGSTAPTSRAAARARSPPPRAHAMAGSSA